MNNRRDASLAAAFLTARYTVHGPGGDVVLTIGRHSTELARLMASAGQNSLALVTAFNPHARPCDAQANTQAQQALRQAAQALGLPCMAGRNSAPDGGEPVEPTVAIAGISLEQARALADQFGQQAFVYAGADALPRLVRTAP